MQAITVTVNVPEGDQCTDETPLSMKVCDFYRGRSCVLFNKVIIEQKKCSECEETSQFEGKFNATDRTDNTS